MKIFCTASHDAYITNKIINQNLRVEDANVGRAGTLDLFRLYGETLFKGTGSQDEVSRILVKFDYGKLRSLTGSKADLNSDNFSAKLKLFDVRGGHPVPSNFTVIVHPLSQSFDEGVGKDVSGFTDIGSTNFITASISNGVVSAWHRSGANAEGLMGDSVDIIGSGNLGSGVEKLFSTQFFPEGTEDLVVDVTKVVSSTIAGQMKNHGFRISFSGSDESDSKSRFIKRFASRHVANPYIRPKIEVSFDDSIQDHRGNFLFDVSGSLFLQNYNRSSLANLVSGSTQISGDSCLKVKLKKGQYEFTSVASQHKAGTHNESVKGLYSASFGISSVENSKISRKKTLAQLISDEKSVEFTEFWYSNDGSVGFHTGSITISLSDREDNLGLGNLEVYAINAKSSYSKEDEERIRIFAIDHDEEFSKPRKKAYSRKSKVFENVYYRVRDADSLKIIFDFDEEKKSTRISTDSKGMFFDFHFDVLPHGRSYLFEYLIVNRGTRKIIRDKRTRFTIG